MLARASGSYHVPMSTVGPQSEFASFLKTRRRSIPPDSMTLGSWERLPVRRGRRVTQEEIAEAVGISRNWYRRLESGDAARASARLLDRIARALQFTPEERTNLFVLGIPELAQMRPI
jgi:DNA-binding XRE family transcriptional regulator